MTKRTYRQFSPEFKRETVRLVLLTGQVRFQLFRHICFENFLLCDKTRVVPDTVK